MPLADPNRHAVVTVARRLQALSTRVVFVGGASVGLLLTDPAAPQPRPTDDVDLIVEVASRFGYLKSFNDELRKLRFHECSDPGAPICR
jgi:hypothetical protein